MNSSSFVVFIIALCSLSLSVAVAKSPEKKQTDGYPSSAKWEKTIAKVEAQDAKKAPPEGAIVAVGSSSMRGWHRTIKKDLAPLTIIPRGFGGSNYNDALTYADRNVIPYKPRAVLIYEGDNDIAQGISPEQVHETYVAFIDKVSAALPETRFYVISIKPSIKRWNMWPKMQEANALIQAETEKHDNQYYIDVSEAMLDDNGEPIPELFKKDNLHMTPDGYALWTTAIKPVLINNESEANEVAVNNGDADM